VVIEFHWSRIHHGLVVAWVACVTGCSSITYVGELAVLNYLSFFDCPASLVLLAFFFAE
jgi:hypothetical protein